MGRWMGGWLGDGGWVGGKMGEWVIQCNTIRCDAIQYDAMRCNDGNHTRPGHLIASDRTFRALPHNRRQNTGRGSRKAPHGHVPRDDHEGADVGLFSMAQKEGWSLQELEFFHPTQRIGPGAAAPMHFRFPPRVRGGVTYLGDPRDSENEAVARRLMEPPDGDAMAQHKAWLMVMDLAAHKDRDEELGATFDAFHERVAEREGTDEAPGVRLRAVVKRRLKGSAEEEKWLVLLQVHLNF